MSRLIYECTNGVMGWTTVCDHTIYFSFVLLNFLGQRLLQIVFLEIIFHKHYVVNIIPLFCSTFFIFLYLFLM